MIREDKRRGFLDKMKYHYTWEVFFKKKIHIRRDNLTSALLRYFSDTWHFIQGCDLKCVWTKMYNPHTLIDILGYRMKRPIMNRNWQLPTTFSFVFALTYTWWRKYWLRVEFSTLRFSLIQTFWGSLNPKIIFLAVDLCVCYQHSPWKKNNIGNFKFSILSFALFVDGIWNFS